MPKLYTRAEWNAKPPRYTYPLPVYPVREVYIHHGATPTPSPSVDDEMSVVRGYQNYHMNSRGWSDIAYNLLVGQSGNGYAGRGYRNQGGATGNNLDRQSISICFVGDSQNDRPSQAAINMIVYLIDLGIRAGHIHPDVVVKGHRDGYGTSCPGDKMYALIPEIQASLNGEANVIPFEDWRVHYNQTEYYAAPDGIVAFVQDRLTRHGFPTAIDGIKGQSTDAQVREFELANGHNGDDKFGRPSWETLLSLPEVTVEVPVPTIPEELDAAVRATHDEASKALYIVNTSE